VATNTYAEIHNNKFFPSAVSEPTREAQETRLLLNRLAEGDHAAFWLLWEQHKKHLYTICLSQMKGMHNDAEDALSEAMLKAWHQLPRYAYDIENCKAWLTRLTYNLCRDVHKRSKKFIASEGVEDLKDEFINRPRYFRASQIMESPEDALLRREVEIHLLHAINKLPAHLRDLFILRVIQERTYPELAERFAISVENARKRIQKARDILQKEIAVYFSGGKPLIPKKRARDEITHLTASVRPRLEDRGEIKVDINATRVLHIPLASGEARAIHLFLSQIPARPETRLNTLCEYIERHPRGWKKRLERADLLYATGCWDEAVEEYREVLKIQPRSVAVCAQLGNTLHLLGRDEEAVAIYKMALRETRSEGTRLHLAGLIADCLGQFNEAIERFKKAAFREPQNSIHWLRLGMTCLASGNAARAIEAFDEALKISPDDIMALSESYIALRALGRDEEARQRVERVLRVCPGDVPSLKRMADHRCRLGLVRGREGKKTRQLILYALRLAPNAPEILGSLACYHISRREWDKGLTFLACINKRHLGRNQKSDHRRLLRDGTPAINAFRHLDESDTFSYQIAYELVTSRHQMNDSKS